MADTMTAAATEAATAVVQATVVEVEMVAAAIDRRAHRENDMPTYAFSTTKELSVEQRARLAESVTSIHQVEATAPRYFVQVIFYKVDAGSIFIAGEPASDDHVWVRADIRAGRSREQKARILQRIMRETSDILQISAETVWVYISDIPAEAVAEFGAILPQPGGEAEWLTALPSALREKLTAAS